MKIENHYKVKQEEKIFKCLEVSIVLNIFLKILLISYTPTRTKMVHALAVVIS